MIRFKKDVFLQRSRLNLVLKEKLVLSDDFDGILFVAFIGQLGEVDFAKRALADLTLYFEVLQRDYPRTLALYFQCRWTMHVLPQFREYVA